MTSDSSAPSVKLSERIRKQLELDWCDPADAANELGVFLHNILSDVEALERDHLKLIAELSELRTRIRHNMEIDGYGIECINRFFGVSEEAKQE